jgi:hypothetical protein
MNEFEDFVGLDVEFIKNNIKDYSSTQLCEMVVCDRYIGFGQEVSLYCMEELAKRRINGDPFDYEEFIETSLKELPVINFKLPNTSDIRSILKNIKF